MHSGRVFLNETIGANFLIKRPNKKIGGNCLNKPLCSRWVPPQNCDDLCLPVNAHDGNQSQKGLITPQTDIY